MPKILIRFFVPITDNPCSRIISLSAGETVHTPCGLKHKPGKRLPNLSSVISPNLASFRPEHLFGSHYKEEKSTNS